MPQEAQTSAASPSSPLIIISAVSTLTVIKKRGARGKAWYGCAAGLGLLLAMVLAVVAYYFFQSFFFRPSMAVLQRFCWCESSQLIFST
jgi:hypothetical protein